MPKEHPDYVDANELEVGLVAPEGWVASSCDLDESKIEYVLNGNYGEPKKKAVVYGSVFYNWVGSKDSVTTSVAIKKGDIWVTKEFNGIPFNLKVVSASRYPTMAQGIWTWSAILTPTEDEPPASPLMAPLSAPVETAEVKTLSKKSTNA